MTIDEARGSLRNTKVYVEGKSREIQKKLFALGINWENPSDTPKKCEYPYLYIEGTPKGIFIRCGWNENIFREIEEFKRIYALDILTLKYARPFKDMEEVFRELQKHSPIGWIKGPKQYGYRFITGVIDNKILLTSQNIKSIYEVNFEVAFRCFKFTDGSYFGIEEV